MLNSTKHRRVITGFTSILLLMLTACSSAPDEEPPAEAQLIDVTHEDEGYGFHTHQIVKDYTDRLAHDLLRKYQGNTMKPMVVTSFVTFDGSLKNTQKLGNIISESLLGQVQEYGVPVVDIHLMGGVNITSSGDFVFSRDVNEIIYAEGIEYVLSGVLIKGERGFTVNARIMQLSSKTVISTASTFIPTFVVDAI